MVSLAHRMFAICLIAMALPACSPPDKTDLKSLQIPGVEPFDFRDESTLPLDLVTTRLAHDFVARGAARGADGQMLAADAVTTDEDIARSVDEWLGPNWKRSEGFDADRPPIHVMVWETVGKPKRFYAIAAWDKVSVSTKGRAYRPLETVFSRH